jgi:hypothetical protein
VRAIVREIRVICTILAIYQIKRIINKGDKSGQIADYYCKQCIVHSDAVLEAKKRSLVSK